MLVFFCIMNHVKEVKTKLIQSSARVHGAPKGAQRRMLRLITKALGHFLLKSDSYGTLQRCLFPISV